MTDASTGLEYDGEWKANMRNGSGQMTWPDGRTYVGMWENDK